MNLSPQILLHVNYPNLFLDSWAWFLTDSGLWRDPFYTMPSDPSINVYPYKYGVLLWYWLNHKLFTLVDFQNYKIISNKHTYLQVNTYK